VVIHKEGVAQPMIFNYAGMKEDPTSSIYRMINEVAFGTGLIRPELIYEYQDSATIPLMIYSIDKVRTPSVAYPATYSYSNLFVQYNNGTKLATTITGTT